MTRRTSQVLKTQCDLVGVGFKHCKAFSFSMEEEKKKFFVFLSGIYEVTEVTEMCCKEFKNEKNSEYCINNVKKRGLD